MLASLPRDAAKTVLKDALARDLLSSGLAGDMLRGIKGGVVCNDTGGTQIVFGPLAIDQHAGLIDFE